MITLTATELRSLLSEAYIAGYDDADTLSRPNSLNYVEAIMEDM